MGYLNKETVTVDAILTKRGRQLLSQGQSAFLITKFAVADDEIDYGLYNPAHPLGTQYYGSAIENMPIVEASPDETQNLRYKLVTLSGDINIIPTLNASEAAINITFNSSPVIPIILETSAISAGQKTLFDQQAGYTATLFDGSAANIIVTRPIEGVVSTPNTIGIGGERTAISRPVTVQGFAFEIQAKNVDRITETQLVITGNESGATITIPITVNPGS